jgi:hypothetical protein
MSIVAYDKFRFFNFGNLFIIFNVSIVSFADFRVKLVRLFGLVD